MVRAHQPDRLSAIPQHHGGDVDVAAGTSASGAPAADPFTAAITGCGTARI
jgi:hypothetical protein